MNNDELLYKNVVKKYKITDSRNVYRKEIDEQMIHDYIQLYKISILKERVIDELEEKLYFLKEKYNEQ